MTLRLRRPRISTLDRNVATSIAASLGVQLLLLLSGVAGARILGVLDRGRSALLLLFASVLPLLGTIGTPTAVTYFVAQNRRVGRQIVRNIRPLVAAQLAGVFVVHGCVLYVVFHDGPANVQVAAAVSLLGTPSIAVWMYGLALLQGNHQFKALNLCRLIFPLINAALLMAFLVTGVGNLVIVTVTWVALYSLSALITWIIAVRGLAEDFDDPRASDEIPAVGTITTFGLKALLGAVTPLESFQLDQAIVGVFVSQAALGIYVVAVAFTNLPRFVAQSIGLVAYPSIAAEKSPHGLQRQVLRFTAMTLVLCGATVAITELALPLLVPQLFGSPFRPAIDVARILLISALLLALRRVLTECARGAGRPGLGSLAEVLSLVSLFAAVALLFKPDARGVALALVLSAAISLAAVIVGLLVRPTRPRSASEPGAAAEPFGPPVPPLIAPAPTELTESLPKRADR